MALTKSFFAWPSSINIGNCDSISRNDRIGEYHRCAVIHPLVCHAPWALSERDRRGKKGSWTLPDGIYQAGEQLWYPRTYGKMPVSNAHTKAYSCGWQVFRHGPHKLKIGYQRSSIAQKYIQSGSKKDIMQSWVALVLFLEKNAGNLWNGQIYHGSIFVVWMVCSWWHEINSVTSMVSVLQLTHQIFSCSSRWDVLDDLFALRQWPVPYVQVKTSPHVIDRCVNLIRSHGRHHIWQPWQALPVGTRSARLPGAGISSLQNFGQPIWGRWIRHWKDLRCCCIQILVCKTLCNRPRCPEYVSVRIQVSWEIAAGSLLLSAPQAVPPKDMINDTISFSCAKALLQKSPRKTDLQHPEDDKAGSQIIFGCWAPDPCPE